MLRISRILAVVFGASTTVCDASASDINLLQNGDFSAVNQISNWSTFGNASWSTDDAGSNPNSGALKLDMDESVPASEATSTCFAITPGATYAFAGLGSASPALTPGLQMGCYAYADALCTQAEFVANLSPFGLQPLGTSWTPLMVASGNLPAAAHSVRCVVSADVTLSNLPTTVLVDNLYFNSAQPTTPVTLQSFEVN